MLALGIFFLPLVFAWVVLAKGYSARARWISFSWMTAPLLVAIIFAKPVEVPTVRPAAPVVADAAQTTTPDPELDASQARLKRSTADLAYTFLVTARPSANETAEHFNARVTKLYNNWVDAEKAGEGSDWQQAYLNRQHESRDCSDLNGPFSHNDAQLRQARAACAAAAYAPASSVSVPTLDDFLMKTEVTTDAEPEPGETDQVVGASQGQ